MDAQAYLIRHGWSGPGNPLNPNRRPGQHGGLGLTRPILVARKQNNHGIGKGSTQDYTNQWWLRGLEEALKAVGQNGRVETRSEPNSLAGGTGELYKFFVKGDGLPGTVESKRYANDEEVVPAEITEDLGKESIKEGVKYSEKRRKRRREKCTMQRVESKGERALEIQDGRKRRKLDISPTGSKQLAIDTSPVLVEIPKENGERKKHKKKKDGKSKERGKKTHRNPELPIAP
jgi:nucleolar protein TMA23